MKGIYDEKKVKTYNGEFATMEQKSTKMVKRTFKSITKAVHDS